MADVHSKATRSYNMSRIKGKNTKPEILVRRFLHAHGHRYRLHVKSLPGKPDIVLPKTRTQWWLNKINGNIANDIKAVKALKKERWKIINLWECHLKPTKIE